MTGSAATWAYGIIYAIGFVNFLQDKSSSPYVSATELADAFDIAQARQEISQNKSVTCKKCVNLIIAGPCPAALLTPLWLG
jgi:hypothetical protein